LKKVLVISYDFPPVVNAGSLRALKFAKYFKRFGWEPVVITSTPKTYYFRDENLLEDAVKNGVSVLRTKGPEVNLLTGSKLKSVPNEKTRKFVRNFRRLINIPDEYRSWIPKAVKLASDVIESGNVEIIYAYAPPFSVFIAASELKQKYKIPLVADYGDSWLHSHSSFIPSAFYRLRNIRLEQELIRNADEIIAVNRRIKEYLIGEYDYLKHQDIDVINYGYDPEDFRRGETVSDRNGKKMKITYTGNFFDLSAPEYFLKALAIVFSRNPELRGKIEVCFVGGMSKENLVQIRNNNLTDVVFNPGFVSHSDALRYMTDSDVLWFTVLNGKGSETCSPYKLAEYIGSAKPLLACVGEGASKQILKNHGAVKFCDPDNPDMIADMITEFYELYEKRMMPSASPDILSRFNIELLTRELVKRFEFLRDIKTGFGIKSNAGHSGLPH
jgi:glycosyltransferase involved in cell wall biosynthesis